MCIRDSTGAGIVVIDHDLRFINNICSRLFVLDQGSLIASGEPGGVWADPKVIEVYVGPGVEVAGGSMSRTQH